MPLPAPRFIVVENNSQKTETIMMHKNLKVVDFMQVDNETAMDSQGGQGV